VYTIYTYLAELASYGRQATRQNSRILISKENFREFGIHTSRWSGASMAMGRQALRAKYRQPRLQQAQRHIGCPFTASMAQWDEKL
jgi:hypothetical protein